MAEQGLTMQGIADTLSSDGLRSVTGKPFYAGLIGAFLSKTRRKDSSCYVGVVVGMKPGV